MVEGNDRHRVQNHSTIPQTLHSACCCCRIIELIRRQLQRQCLMTQGKRISANIGEDALQAIRELGASARLGRSAAGEGQAAAAARLGVHVQTIGRIEAGEPGVAIGHVLGLLALYGIGVRLQQPEGS